MQSAPLRKSPSLAVVDKPQLKPYGRPLAEILADLAKPLPNRFLQARRQGGKELTYLSWHHANRLMDYFTGGGWEGKKEVLEEWIILGLQMGHLLPVIEGIDLSLRKEEAA